MNSEVSLVVDGLFHGYDLEFIEGPITITINAEKGFIENISKGSNGLLNLRGYTALPPLTNLHTHLLDYAIAEEGWDLDIDSVVGEPYGLKYKLLKRERKEILLSAILSAEKIAWNNGIGIIVEFRELGIAGSLLDLSKRDPSHLVLGMPSKHDSSSVDEAKQLLEIDDGLGISSPLYYSQDVLSHIYNLIKGFPVTKHLHAHISETTETHDKGDLEYMLKVMKPSAIIHGTHLTSDEITLLNELNIPLILCLRSNLWFSSGIPDIRSIYNSGIKIGLGSDNAGWIKLDIWREGELLLNMSRLYGVNDPVWVLKAMTISAEIVGLDNAIVEGNRTNLLLVESDPLRLNTAKNKHVAVIKRGGSEYVGALVIDGRPKYCNGKAKTLCNNIRYVIS
jgi:cytosine/adenosine deaminase-related metal-dependent hydrolase